MTKQRTIFACASCGHQSAKWLGRCTGCGAWNSLIEERVEAAPKGRNGDRTFRLPEGPSAREPRPLAELGSAETSRIPTGIGELDGVLGGGLVPGSLVLVGGDPGIGKSTLLLSALDGIARSGERTLYVSGEESPEQVKLRADRLGIDGERVWMLAETRADRIAEVLASHRSSAAVIDSIQAVYDHELDAAPGSVSQVREVAARFLYLAKSLGVPILLVGHVTKEGTLAGPRVLEHLVDTVLYFEHSQGSPYRILRAHKNRFGSTHAIGVFEMSDGGLREVANPSELFLAERPKDAPGSVVFPAVEGHRPVLVEVQALVAPAPFGTPRRTCLGFDPARAALLAAVLEQRAGLQLLGCDVFVNVVGGMQIEEPAADLAVATALASALRNRALPAGTIVFGEVGLAGELRGVSAPERRLAEAKKLGFTRAVMPASSATRIEAPEGMKVLPAKTLEEALQLGLG